MLCENTTYFAKDTHNDIVAELNGEGAITSSHNFDAFGNPDTAPFVSGFGYTGEYTDTESGLIYLRNRYYEPETGRFINEDSHWNPGNMIYGDESEQSEKVDDDEKSKSFEQKLDDTMVGNAEKTLGIGKEAQKIPSLEAICQAGNLYVYGLNNPVNYTDPSGEIAVVDDAAFLIVGIVVVVVSVCYANTYNPDQYGRAGQKKQGREVKEKKRKGNWSPNPNKKPSPPKKHTPGKDHRKY